MLKIYGVPISVHTRKVIVVALAKDLPHEIVPVVPVIPDDPPPNWRQLSPTGKIPALTDGDFTIADSAAICAYLERLRPDPPVYPQLHHGQVVQRPPLTDHGAAGHERNRSEQGHARAVEHQPRNLAEEHPDVDEQKHDHDEELHGVTPCQRADSTGGVVAAPSRR